MRISAVRSTSLTKSVAPFSRQTISRTRGVASRMTVAAACAASSATASRLAGESGASGAIRGCSGTRHSILLVDGTNLQRHPAFGRASPRKLPRGGEELGAIAAPVRVVLLRRELPRHYGALRAAGTGAAHAGNGGGAPRRRDRPVEGDPVRPVSGARAYRARVDFQHDHAVRRARAAGCVQGEGGEAGAGDGGDLQLPRPAGGGHPALPRGPRSRGRRPGPAPRAVARS